MARMLGRHGWHLHGHSGQHQCGECASGENIDRRARRRAEEREWRREAARTVGVEE